MALQHGKKMPNHLQHTVVVLWCYVGANKEAVVVEHALLMGAVWTDDDVRRHAKDSHLFAVAVVNKS